MRVYTQHRQSLANSKCCQSDWLLFGMRVHPRYPLRAEMIDPETLRPIFQCSHQATWGGGWREAGKSRLDCGHFYPAGL